MTASGPARGSETPDAAARPRLPLAACLLGTAAYLLLTAKLPVRALADAGWDDALYVRLAARLATGQWLGPYNHATLARAPIYPIWIAFNHSLHCPLLLSQGALYAAAVAFFVAALVPEPWPRAALAAIFLACLFNPINYCLSSVRVLREGLYVPLTVAIAAGAAWHLRLATARFRRRIVFSAFFGLLLGLFWLTREEGLWIVPALLLVPGLAAASRLGSGPTQRRALVAEAALAGAAWAFAAAPAALLGAVNHRHYGVWVTAELKQPEFRAAYGALSRIGLRRRRRFVPVSREAIALASAASPAFAEAAALLDPGWIEFGCREAGIEPCDGEFRGGWFYVALRAAAARAGHHRSAGEARRFYRQVADELNGACARGGLPCLPARATLRPVFQREQLPATAAALWAGLDFLVRLRRADVGPQLSRGLPYQYDLFRMMIAGPLEPLAGRPPAADDARESVFAPLWAIAVVYRRATPAVVGAALACFLLSWRRGREFTFPRRVNMVLLAMILGRLLLLAYMDAASAPIVNEHYLAPLHPLLFLFCGVSLAEYLSGPRFL